MLSNLMVFYYDDKNAKKAFQEEPESLEFQIESYMDFSSDLLPDVEEMTEEQFAFIQKVSDDSHIVKALCDYIVHSLKAQVHLFPSLPVIEVYLESKFAEFDAYFEDYIINPENLKAFASYDEYRDYLLEELDNDSEEDENCEDENCEDENCEDENCEDENCEDENCEDENCEDENCEDENCEDDEYAASSDYFVEDEEYTCESSDEPEIQYPDDSEIEEIEIEFVPVATLYYDFETHMFSHSYIIKGVYQDDIITNVDLFQRYFVDALFNMLSRIIYLKYPDTIDVQNMYAFRCRTYIHNALMRLFEKDAGLHCFDENEITDYYNLLVSRDNK